MSSEAFSALVRSPDGPFVSVDVVDTLNDAFSGVALFDLILAIVMVTAWRRGRYRVEVGVNRGPRLETSSRRYKRVDVALEEATRLVEDVKTTGLPAITAWNEKRDN